jgi:hypothetical protein
MDITITLEKIIGYSLSGILWASSIPLGIMLSRLAGELYAQDFFEGEMINKTTQVMSFFSFICFGVAFGMPASFLLSIFELELPAIVTIVGIIGVASFSMFICSKLITCSAKKKHKALEKNPETIKSVNNYIKNMVMMSAQEEKDKDKEKKKSPFARRSDYVGQFARDLKIVPTKTGEEEVLS